MFDTRTSLFFFACLKDAAGAALKNAAPATGSDQQKNRLRLWSPLKSGGSGSRLRLRNTAGIYPLHNAVNCDSASATCLSEKFILLVFAVIFKKLYFC